MNCKLILLGAVSFLTPTLRAQGTAPFQIPTIVTGAPFSGQLWTISQIANADGTVTQLAQRTDISRGGDGSTRRESLILSGSAPNLQASGTSYIDIQSISGAFVAHLDGPSKSATIHLLKKQSKVLYIPAALPNGAVPVGQTQNLGSRTIGDYTTVGSRQTLLLPKGTQSQDQDVTWTLDTWYCAALQSVLLKDVTDTLGNSSETTLQQITAGEPDPSLFTIPTTYTSNRTAPQGQ